jgi:hypothetical protein
LDTRVGFGARLLFGKVVVLADLLRVEAGVHCVVGIYVIVDSLSGKLFVAAIAMYSISVCIAHRLLALTKAATSRDDVVG